MKRNDWVRGYWQADADMLTQGDILELYVSTTDEWREGYKARTKMGQRKKRADFYGIGAALALVLLSMNSAGCGEPGRREDFVSQLGSSFFLEGGSFTKDEADAQEVYFLAGLDHRYSLDRWQIHHVGVIVYAEPFHCAAGKCAGEQVEQALYIDTHYGPENSAYLHELMHLIQEFNGISDYQHTRVSDWKLADGYASRRQP